MPDNRTALSSIPPPQMLRVDGEPDRKKLVGRDVERSFELLGISKQDAAYRMGYSDPGTISRWCAGTERPHFDKLEAIRGFDQAYMKAKAERIPRTRRVTIIELIEEEQAS